MVDYEKNNYRIVIFVGVICVVFFLVILIGTIVTNSNNNDDVIDTHSLNYVVDNFKCSYSSNLSAISDGNKIGFIDRDKRFVIDYTYDIPNVDYCDSKNMIYNFYGNYAIVYKDKKYVVINKDNVVVNSFDDIYTLNLNNNDIKCLYVSTGGDVKFYCIDRNKIIDVGTDSYSIENGKIKYNSKGDTTIIYGDFLLYKKDGKDYCYNLKTDSNFEFGGYGLNITLDYGDVPKSDSSLFTKYSDSVFSVKNSDYENLFILELEKKYDSILFIPSPISSGKYYFMVRIGDKFGVMDSSGNEVIPVNKDVVNNGNSSVKINNNTIIINKNDNSKEKYYFTGKLIEE